MAETADDVGIALFAALRPQNPAAVAAAAAAATAATSALFLPSFPLPPTPCEPPAPPPATAVWDGTSKADKIRGIIQEVKAALEPVPIDNFDLSDEYWNRKARREERAQRRQQIRDIDEQVVRAIEIDERNGNTNEMHKAIEQARAADNADEEAARRCREKIEENRQEALMRKKEIEAGKAKRPWKSRVKLNEMRYNNC